MTDHAIHKILGHRVPTSSESRVFSQNGEDGLISYLLKNVGLGNMVFAEIGVGDGMENNTRLLATQGWRGFWFSPEVPLNNVPESVVYTDCKVVPRTVATIFRDAGVPTDLDVLSIDIDSEDYWVWDALSDFTPRIVVIEYNAAYPPPESVSVPYNDTLIPTVWDGTNYFGASIEALAILGKRKGYRLVACDKRGVNIFFVHNEYANELAEITTQEAYNIRGYWSHPTGRKLPPV